jgi:Lar family restriction alleviation protein
MTATERPSYLKPCPFCGGKAEIERLGDGRRSTIYSCTDCGCSLETGETFAHGAMWNRRTLNAAPADPVVSADAIARKDAEIAAANAEIDELVRALKLCTQRAERVEARVREAPVVQVAPPYTASMHGMRGIHCVTINVIGEDAIAIGGKRVALVLLDTEEAK